jgi:hypothetical protein
MSDPKTWDTIFGADSTRVVLGVDFPARRHLEASFCDLAARIGPGYRFLRPKPSAARWCPRSCGDAYVGPWIEGIRQSSRQVLAVLGHRVGSVYAAAIAKGISQWQPAPKLILFDPRVASIDQLDLEFRAEISSLSCLLSDDELERARKIAAEISRLSDGDIWGIAAELAESYFEVITAAFERAGLGDARSDKFSASFESYLEWLSAACQIDSARTWKSSTVIVTSAYEGLPDRANSADGRNGAGRMISLDVTHADLLRSDSAARIVLDLLEE